MQLVFYREHANAFVTSLSKKKASSRTYLAIQWHTIVYSAYSNHSMKRNVDEAMFACVCNLKGDVCIRWCHLTPSTIPTFTYPTFVVLTPSSSLYWYSFLCHQHCPRQISLCVWHFIYHCQSHSITKPWNYTPSSWCYASLVACKDQTIRDDVHYIT